MDRQGRVGTMWILVAMALVSFLSVFLFDCFLTWSSRLAVIWIGEVLMYTPRMWTEVDLAVLTACSFACQALEVMADHAKDGWKARVSLRPRRQ